MVFASMSPLFAIWAIKGSSQIDDILFIPICLLSIIIPNILLLARLLIVKKNNITRKKLITSVKNQDDNLLLYLFAMLIPLITGDLDSTRAIFTMIAALLFLGFLFWHLNLYYLNIVFAIFGYKMYTVFPNDSSGDFTPFVLLTKRNWVNLNSQIDTWCISDTVFIEREPDGIQYGKSNYQR